MPVNCTSTSKATQAWKPYGDVEIREFCPDSGETIIYNLGQVSEINIAYEIEEDSLPDYRLGQGESASDSQITSMGLGMVCHELGDLDVLALLALGERATTAANASASEVCRGYLGKSLWLDNIPTGITSIQSVKGAAASTWAGTNTQAVGDAVVPTVANDFWYECSVAGDTGAGEPTWPTVAGQTVVDGTVTWTCMGRIDLEADTDYTVGNFGPSLLDTARVYTGADNDVGVDFTITYSHADQNVVHAGMHTGREYEVKFLGYNKALSDKQMLVHIYRAKSAPPDQLPLNSVEYAGPNTTFKILSYSGAAANESSFWTYREAA